MDRATAFQSKWVRLGVSAPVAVALWLAAFYAAFALTWTDENPVETAFLYVVIYALPGLACAAVAWYSKTVWSGCLAIFAALVMREVIVPCEPDRHSTWSCTPGTVSFAAELAVMLPILFAWAVGYWLGRRAT
ncbi:MAG: hypothetical protein ACRDKE_09060 [Solirubrobacterales bacterium]